MKNRISHPLSIDAISMDLQDLNLIIAVRYIVMTDRTETLWNISRQCLHSCWLELLSWAEQYKLEGCTLGPTRLALRIGPWS